MALASKWHIAVLAVAPIAFSSCGGAGDRISNVTSPVETAGSNEGFEDLNLGEIQELEFSDSGATLSFGDGSNENDFFLIINSTNRSSANYTLQLSRGSSAALTLEGPGTLGVEGSDEDPSSQFHQFLREIEEVVRQSGDFEEVRPSSVGALTAAVTLGDLKSFRVLSTMNSITTYEEVPAKLRYLSGDLLIFVDQSAASQVSDEDIEKLANDFEGIALPRERELFGNESDINGDGRVSILMSCVLNRMATSGGIVTGFFFPGDLYQRSSVNPASNAQEIFYTLVPDPDGDCGSAPITRSFVIDNILPGVLAHEYQHMVSFNQHLFKNGGSTEEPWLNECLAHFAEDITGFGKENPSRVKLFLNQPSQAPIIPPTSPTLTERGGCYLFLRYLYEQSADGDAFIQNLLNTNLTGVANLENAFASAQGGADPDFDTFPEFLNRWSVALALSGTGLTSDARYNYVERSPHPGTGNFTGICIRCDAQDGRGTVLDGPVITTVSSFPNASNVRATATQFYRLVEPTGTIQVGATGGPTLAGALVRLERN